MRNLLKRFLSAVVLLPPVLFLIYKGGIYINLLVGLVVLLCAIEFYRMLGFVGFDLLFSLLLTSLAYFGMCYFFADALIIIVGILLIACMYILFTIRDAKGASRLVGYCFSGIVYTGIFPSFIPLIRNTDNENGFYHILTFLSVIWFSDTFAYFIGSSIGKHKLYEKISPKKTLEGSIGGIVGGFIGIYIMALLFHKTPSLGFTLMIGIFVNLIGQVGDLFESMLKRDANIKDSGSIIPGHGGMLDRVDAIIFSAPVMYIIVRYLL